MDNKVTVDLEDLRSEYESTYLAYVRIGDKYLSFEKWLLVYKGLVIKIK